MGFFIPCARFRVRGFFDLPAFVEKAREFCDSGFLKKVGIHAYAVFPFRKGRQSFFELAFNMALASVTRQDI